MGWICETFFLSLSAFPIPVTITASTGQSPVYTPGSSVQFMCSASGQFGPVVTTWTSTCSGSCFVLQQSAQQSIRKDILHAVDSGNHTCSVEDDVGNTGSSTIELLVSGTNTWHCATWYNTLHDLGVQMYSFDSSNPGLIPNNSIILTNNFGQMPRLQCISGSRSPGVGQWLAPSGQDITYSNTDPFDITVGGASDPGYLDISLHPGQIVTLRDQGVYSCRIPDETGENSSVLVGIYLPALTSEWRRVESVHYQQCTVP